MKNKLKFNHLLSNPISTSQHYKMSSSQEKALNESNFIYLEKISKNKKIQLIKTRFQLKRYNIKYEAIRKNNFYKQLKP